MKVTILNADDTVLLKSKMEGEMGDIASLSLEKSMD